VPTTWLFQSERDNIKAR